MKEIIRLLLPPIVPLIWRKLFGKAQQGGVLQSNNSALGSYSQFQEDLIIDSILLGSQHGFYVDIGAHDPRHLSNTCRFYERGWRGINIEPQVNCFRKFEEQRTLDINLNCGVHSKQGELTFYQLELEALSTFDKALAERNARRYKCRIVSQYPVPVKPLVEILDERLPVGTSIDFMSIDTEGNEMNVLAGNDWEKYRPALLVIEYGDELREIHDTLQLKGYALAYKNSLNAMFIDQRNSRFAMKHEA